MRSVKHWAGMAVLLMLSVLLLAPSSAQAQTWPQRPVRFLVPLGAGSGVDITARMFADRLSKKWGQPVVVEDRPGGDGIVAITAFLGANDDHVLLFSPTGSFTAHPYLHENLPYDPKALAPIARVSSTLVIIATSASLKVDSVKDLIDMARKSPGKLNWASATGTNELLFLGYLKQHDLQMAKVPYKNTVEALNDLAEGRIDVFIGAYAIVRAQAQNGKVKVLALLNHERAPNLDIPTVAEAGEPDLGFDGLVGLFGPPSMPLDLRERIATDVKAVAQDPEVIAKLTATGQVIVPGGAAEFTKATEEQRAQVSAVGKALGIKPAK